MHVRIPPRSARVIGAAVVALVLTAQSAGAFAVRSLATAVNPFASCVDNSTPGSVNYPNAEVEPYVAVSPLNPRTIIGAVQQDRWNDGGAHGLTALVSKDGGVTFTSVALPFTSCAPGGLPFTRASDPWVSFGPDGTAYAVALSFDGATNRNGVAAATSRNGGLTWQNAQMLVMDDTGPFHDKESVTADPNVPGTAYVVWDVTPPGANAPAPSLFSKTTNFGKTWSAPLQITQSGATYGDIGNILLVDGHGTLYDVFGRYHYDNDTNEYLVIVSRNGGATWSAPRQIAQDLGVYDFDPHAGGPYLRTAARTLASAAIDWLTGQLYVTWEDARYSATGRNQIVLSTSTDGARTWSSPTVVSAVTGATAFNPQITVSLLGDVAVTYRDFRTWDGTSAGLPTSTWLRVSRRGGASFGRDVSLAPAFDMLTAPDAGGKFIGDYDGLAPITIGFAALDCVTTGVPSNPTDCWFSIAR